MADDRKPDCYDNWGTVLRDNFDKILLVILVAMFVGVVIHVTHHSTDTNLLSWAETQGASIVGALLTLITGKLLRGNGNGKVVPGPTGDSAPQPPQSPAELKPPQQ